MPGKFLFDVNIFDDNNKTISKGASGETPEAPDEEKPRVYSQAELDRAKDQSFKEGHTQAGQESEASLALSMSNTMKQIKAQIDTLIIDESARQKAYERDVIDLVMKINQKTFPLLEETYGKDIVKAKLIEAMDTNYAQKPITVYVSEAMEDDIKTYFENEGTQHVTVTVDPDLMDLQCRATWSDGGIVVDHNQVLEKTYNILRELLEETSQTGHDNNSPHETVAASNSENVPTEDTVNKDTKTDEQ